MSEPAACDRERHDELMAQCNEAQDRLKEARAEVDRANEALMRYVCTSLRRDRERGREAREQG